MRQLYILKTGMVGVALPATNETATALQLKLEQVPPLRWLLILPVHLAGTSQQHGGNRDLKLA